MILRINFENGNVITFPLSSGYSYVEVNDVEVIKKHEAYDVVKWIKTYNKFPLTRYFLLYKEYIFPISEQASYSGISGKVINYQIIEGDIVYQTYTPCDMTFEEASTFWKHIFSIPI